MRSSVFGPGLQTVDLDGKKLPLQVIAGLVAIGFGPLAPGSHRHRMSPIHNYPCAYGLRSRGGYYRQHAVARVCQVVVAQIAEIGNTCRGADRDLFFARIRPCPHQYAVPYEVERTITAPARTAAAGE